MAQFGLGNYFSWAPNLGGSGFGGKDWDHARSLGMNDAQMKVLGGMMIRGLGSNNPNAIGQRVKDEMNKLGAANPWDYGGYGMSGFGGMDLNAALGQGATYADIQKYADHATSNSLGVGGAVTDWLANEKDNLTYFDANQRRELQLQDQLDAESRANAQWEIQVAKQKELNPKTSAQNQRMTASNAGGVAVKRSDDFRNIGSAARSTAQAGRGMFIDALNI